MKIYDTIRSVVPLGRSAVALGFFDGLHIGHFAVIERAIAQKTKGLCPCVFTFTMHQRRPEKKPIGSELITPSQKANLLSQWGIALVLCPDFSEFQAMQAQEFVEEVLVRRLHAAQVCCGEDFRFGANAMADANDLKRLCDAHGIQVDLIPAVCIDGQRISSTQIRALLRAGEVNRANRLLGRVFGYDFQVIQGKQLGRTLDFPTINQKIPETFIKLRYGVYASVALADGKWYPAVTNIGLRPTVEDSEAVNSETYIIGYTGDLYGQSVQVELLEFLRDEQKFSSVQELKMRIQADAKQAEPIALAYLNQ